MFQDENKNEWFELEEDLWLPPQAKPKKLKLCSDASVPQRVIEELRDAGVPVLTPYEGQVATLADDAILAWSKRQNRVLLTMDRDFWDDQKFPLSIAPGVIFIDVPPEDIDAALEALGLSYMGHSQEPTLLTFGRGKKGKSYSIKIFPETAALGRSHHPVRDQAGTGGASRSGIGVEMVTYKHENTQ